jgi:hypothetical protein
MLQSGPFPQQTMSGGLGGAAWFAVFFGIVGLAVVCATAEAKAAGSRRIAIERISLFPISRNLLFYTDLLVLPTRLCLPVLQASKDGRVVFNPLRQNQPPPQVPQVIIIAACLPSFNPMLRLRVCRFLSYM